MNDLSIEEALEFLDKAKKKGIEEKKILKEKEERKKRTLEKLLFRQKNENLVLLERKQINIQNPAIARLIINFPANQLDHTWILNFFKRYEEKNEIKTREVKIEKMTSRNYFVEVRSNKNMYSWIEEFIEILCEELQNRDYKFSFLEGEWSLYEVKNK